MEKSTKHASQSEATQAKLIAAAQALMLRQGYAGTTVDEICAEAGLTKGSFFHHYASKEAICRAAVDAWGAMGTRLYAEASSDPNADPLDQLHRLFDIMISFTTRDEPTLCMVGMMSQELALTNPAMRTVCAGHLEDWTRMVVRMLSEAKRVHWTAVDFDPVRVGWLLNAIWQGSMLIAKTRQSPEMIRSNLELARAYVVGLFANPPAPARAPRKRSA
ncbi:MAG: TetR/AcrR family transcriptional regulator [Planctomycetes bacterium]|nr:TetR/AcrR family transcriptional regulator [Planctomycetota bacterium]